MNQHTRACAMTASIHPRKAVTFYLVAEESRAVVRIGEYPSEASLFFDLDELAHAVKVVTEAYDTLCAEVAARSLDSDMSEVDR